MPVISNATHALDTYAVEVVERLMREHSPVDLKHVSLSIRFVPEMREPSDSRTNLSTLEEIVTGDCSFRFNPMYIHQSPGIFFHEVVLHEVAHVLDAISAHTEDRKIEIHGPAWKVWMETLGFVDEASPSPGKGVFRSAAGQLRKGGVLIGCECPGDAGWQVVSVKAFEASRRTAEQCSHCGEVFHAKPEDVLPNIIQQDLKLYDALVALSRHHDQEPSQ